MHPAVREFYNLEEVWGGKTVRMASKAIPTSSNARPKRKARAKAKRPRGKR
jgi:hypothetical protein